MVEGLIARLESWNWSAAVFGLGYVGLPLVVTMARAGIEVTGFDIDPGVARGLARGRSHIDDVTDADLAAVADRVRFTSEVSEVRDRDVLFLCVPTPLRVGKQPDLSYIEGAARLASEVLRPGHLVILESTTYPGTTEEVLLPILASTGLALDRDFLLAYSPERVDPGNPSFHTGTIPRIVGGVSEPSTRAAAACYARFVEKVHVVSNARVAEMAKLLENTFRWVNIGLANEMSFVARALGVDIWEVIEAAATKPFGFMPFYPGPGVGGHCIPLDPFYLRWAAEGAGEGTRFIELAAWVNQRMPRVVVERVQEALNQVGKPVNGSELLLIGAAYKPNVSDWRESPAVECLRELRRLGAAIRYHDPHVPRIAVDGVELESVPLTPAILAGSDCVLILIEHDELDYPMIAAQSPLVFDVRDALRRRGLDGPNVKRL